MIIRISGKSVKVAQRAGIPQSNGGLFHSDPTLSPFSPICETAKTAIPTKTIEAIVASFDLSGFTAFCSQASRSTDVPKFLNGFLEWLFRKIEQENATCNGVAMDPLWKEPPFFAKFLGDGILLLWDAGNMVDRQTAKLITILLNVSRMYRSEFYREVSGSINNPPQSLRCCISKGTVFSVNNGRDYVGHCINIAVHLQEHNLFSFCVASGGFSVTEPLEPSLLTQLVSLSLPIRGIRTNEPVWVLRKEVEALKTGNR